jgi:hypothetical protein
VQRLVRRLASRVKNTSRTAIGVEAHQQRTSIVNLLGCLAANAMMPSLPARQPSTHSVASISSSTMPPGTTPYRFPIWIRSRPRSGIEP